MPQPIKLEDMPAHVRLGARGEFAELADYVEKLLRDEKRRAVEGWTEVVDEKKYGHACQAVRTVSKRCGRKVALIYKDGKMHGSDAGPYVGLTPEAAAQRTATRQANKAKAAEGTATQGDKGKG